MNSYGKKGKKLDCQGLCDLVLKSEDQYVRILNMLMNLFIEPVVAVPVDVSNVFRHVEAIADAHILMWRSLETLYDQAIFKQSSRKPEEILKEFCVEAYKLMNLWTVYIPFFTTHDVKQTELRRLLDGNEKFRVLANDVSLLRPGASLSSILQLIRVRPWQMRRYLLHAADLLSKFGETYRSGVFCARGAARHLLQVSEITKLESITNDNRFLQGIAKSYPKLQTIFPPGREYFILWKGFVRHELDSDCRLIICSDRIVLWKKYTSFWSNESYEIVGQWLKGANSRISGALISAKEITGERESKVLYGVRITAKGSQGSIDWKILTADKLTTSSMITAIKEMGIESEEEDDRIYKVSLTLEKEDEWNEEDGEEPKLREFEFRSPKELGQILKEIRFQYEKDSSIVIESNAVKIFRNVGFDELCLKIVPAIPFLCRVIGDDVFTESGAMLSSFNCFDDFLISFCIVFEDYLKGTSQNTMMRDNSPIISLTVKLLCQFGKNYGKIVVEELRKMVENEDMTMEELSEKVFVLIAKLPIPQKLLHLLNQIAKMIEHSSSLKAFKLRALNALFFLRFLSPRIVNATNLKYNTKIAKMLISNLMDNSYKNILDVESFILEKIDLQWSNTIITKKQEEENNKNNNNDTDSENDNAFFDIDTSFVGNDNALEKSESLLIGIIDKLLENKDSIMGRLSQDELVPKHVIENLKEVYEVELK